MKSVVKIYGNLPDFRQKNFVVDNLAGYLSALPGITISSTSPGLLKTLTDFQYVRPSLQTFIKVDLSQGFADQVNCCINYVSIKNGSNGVTYYFVTNVIQRAESTIQLELEMDTLNTFKYNDDYKVSKQTRILREHKDRYDNTHKLPLEQHWYSNEEDINLSDYDYAYDDETWTYNIERYEINYGDNGAVVRVEVLDTTNFNCLEVSSSDVYQDELDYFIDLKIKGYRETGTRKIKLKIFVNEVLSYIRKVDLYPEGINPALYKKEVGTLRDSIDQSFNLVYKTQDEIDPNTPNSVVDTILIPDTSISMKVKTSQWGINRTQLDTILGLNNKSLNLYVAQYYDNLPSTYPDSLRPYYGIINTEFLDINEYNVSAGGRNFAIKSKMYYGTGWTPHWWNEYFGVRVEKGTEAGKITVTYVRNIFEFGLGTDGSVLIYGHSTQELGVVQNVNDIVLLRPVNLCQAFVSEYEDVDLYTIYNNSYAYTTPKLLQYTSGYSYSDSLSFDNFDRTDTKIYKIIRLPYSPSDYVYDDNNPELQVTFSSEWDYDLVNRYFKLVDKNTKFSHTIQSNLYNPIYQTLADGEFPEYVYINNNVLRSNIYESKLYHSEFYQIKFVYDSFSFIFQLEAIDIDLWIQATNSVFTFKFIMTTTINSKFMFEFPEYRLQHSTEDYDNILPVARNNEVVIYNSNYLTYLRTAYNYDLKAKHRTEMTSAIGLGLNIVGQVTSSAIGVTTGTPLTKINAVAGGVSNIASSIINTINTIESAEDQFNSKQDSLKAQSFSTSGADDLDLLEYYSENRAKLVVYQPSEVMRNSIADLFFYCGYATNKMDIPVITTRMRFNFLQADLSVYWVKSNVSQEILDNIKGKFALGVTFLHETGIPGAGSSNNGYWDFEQKYENWESSLVRTPN